MDTRPTGAEDISMIRIQISFVLSDEWDAEAAFEYGGEAAVHDMICGDPDMFCDEVLAARCQAVQVREEEEEGGVPRVHSAEV